MSSKGCSPLDLFDLNLLTARSIGWACPIDTNASQVAANSPLSRTHDCCTEYPLIWPKVRSFRRENRL